MKWMALAFLMLAGVDLAVYATILQHHNLYVLAVACLVAAAVMVWRVGRGKREEMGVSITGWELGAGVEITNPEDPTRVARVVVPDAALKLGALVIGSPGSGKTESAALGFLSHLVGNQGGEGWAYFEGKGDLDIIRKCMGMGARPDYFFSTELAESSSINLMEGPATDVVDRLTRLLIPVTESTSFYSDVQRSVLQRIVPLLVNSGEAVNLRDLYAALTVEAAGRELLNRAAAQNVDPIQLELAKTWFAEPAKQRLAEIKGLLNRLFVFVHGAQTDRLNAYSPDIVIRDLVEQGRKVYFHIPYTAYGRDVAIALCELFAVEARRRQLAGPYDMAAFSLIFDDWGKFFYDGFGPFSARCRSAKLPLFFLFQSRAQLRDVGPNFEAELDDNVASKMVLRVNGEDTAEYAVRLLGEYETAEIATSRADRGGGSSSVQMRRQYRIESRDLRELQPGEAFVSTLIQTPEATRNPLYRVRLPLPEFGNWRSQPIPTPSRLIPSVSGLSLWDRYMNPAVMKQIHQAATQSALAAGAAL